LVATPGEFRIMTSTTVLKACATGLFCLMSALPIARAGASPAAALLVGTWTLVAADVLHPDGTRTRDYGVAPKGLLLMIFKAERPRFVFSTKQPSFQHSGVDRESVRRYE
jgi:hypothetical protein